MAKIGIVNFNTTAISDKMNSFDNLYTINLGISIEGELYTELSMDDLIGKIQATSEVPKTSLPTTGEISQKYEEALKDNDEIIVITPSSELSGTHQNAILAIDLLPEEQRNKVHVVTSQSFVFSEALMIERVIDLIKEGKNSNEIVSEIEGMNSELETYIVPGDLEFMKKSGRINNAQLIAGKLISLKMLVKHYPGEMPDVIKKSRGLKKIAQELVELSSDENAQIYITGIKEDPQEYNDMKALLPNVIELPCNSPILACHFGPKTMGFAIKRK